MTYLLVEFYGELYKIKPNKFREFLLAIMRDEDVGIISYAESSWHINYTVNGLDEKRAKVILDELNNPDLWETSEFTE